eukprot:TRINITY_DN3884_c0_g1_i1.p1 TRINITY_DN3884_c0_g1~~TRINITY_DN3884_c0_g1_i1.p1  ORF type:complete len:1368 (+),score=292.66 TRINITY_DN3884_c0_g1_i1:112-4215(+)
MDGLDPEQRRELLSQLLEWLSSDEEDGLRRQRSRRGKDGKPSRSRRRDGEKEHRPRDRERRRRRRRPSSSSEAADRRAQPHDDEAPPQVMPAPAALARLDGPAAPLGAEQSAPEPVPVVPVPSSVLATVPQNTAHKRSKPQQEHSCDVLDPHGAPAPAKPKRELARQGTAGSLSSVVSVTRVDSGTGSAVTAPRRSGSTMSRQRTPSASSRAQLPWGYGAKTTPPAGKKQPKAARSGSMRQRSASGAPDVIRLATQETLGAELEDAEAVPHAAAPRPTPFAGKAAQGKRKEKERKKSRSRSRSRRPSPPPPPQEERSPQTQDGTTRALVYSPIVGVEDPDSPMLDTFALPRVSRGGRSRSQSPRRAGPIWNRLYRDGLDDRHRRTQAATEHALAREKAAAGHPDCTFRPETNSRSYADDDPRERPDEVFQHLHADSTARRRRIEDLRKGVQEELSQNCTFKPTVNQNPATGRPELKTTAYEKSYFEKLFLEAQDRRVRQQELERKAKETREYRRVTRSTPESQHAFRKRTERTGPQGTVEIGWMRRVFTKSRTGTAVGLRGTEIEVLRNKIEAEPRIEQIMDFMETKGNQEAWEKLVPRTNFRSLLNLLDARAEARTEPVGRITWEDFVELFHACTVTAHADPECYYHPRILNPKAGVRSASQPHKLSSTEMTASVARLSQGAAARSSSQPSRAPQPTPFITTVRSPSGRYGAGTASTSRRSGTATPTRRSPGASQRSASVRPAPAASPSAHPRAGAVKPAAAPPQPAFEAPELASPVAVTEPARQFDDIPSAATTAPSITPSARAASEAPEPHHAPPAPAAPSKPAAPPALLPVGYDNDDDDDDSSAAFHTDENRSPEVKAQQQPRQLVSQVSALAIRSALSVRAPQPLPVKGAPAPAVASATVKAMASTPGSTRGPSPSHKVEEATGRAEPPAAGTQPHTRSALEELKRKMSMAAASASGPRLAAGFQSLAAPAEGGHASQGTRTATPLSAMSGRGRGAGVAVSRGTPQQPQPAAVPQQPMMTAAYAAAIRSMTPPAQQQQAAEDPVPKLHPSLYAAALQRSHTPQQQPPTQHPPQPAPAPAATPPARYQVSKGPLPAAPQLAVKTPASTYAAPHPRAPLSAKAPGPAQPGAPMVKTALGVKRPPGSSLTSSPSVAALPEPVLAHPGMKIPAVTVGAPAAPSSAALGHKTPAVVAVKRASAPAPGTPSAFRAAPNGPFIHGTPVRGSTKSAGAPGTPQVAPRAVTGHSPAPGGPGAGAAPPGFQGPPPGFQGGAARPVTNVARPEVHGAQATTASVSMAMKVIRKCKHCKLDKNLVKVCPITGVEHKSAGGDRDFTCGVCKADTRVLPICPVNNQPHQVVAHHVR